MTNFKGGACDPAAKYANIRGAQLQHHPGSPYSLVRPQNLPAPRAKKKADLPFLSYQLPCGQPRPALPFCYRRLAADRSLKEFRKTCSPLSPSDLPIKRRPRIVERSIKNTGKPRRRQPQTTAPFGAKSGPGFPPEKLPHHRQTQSPFPT